MERLFVRSQEKASEASDRNLTEASDITGTICQRERQIVVLRTVGGRLRLFDDIPSYVCVHEGAR